MSLDQRINDLESRLAFQDDTINTLNEVLIEQQRQIDRLERQMLLLSKRHEDLAGHLEVQVQEAPPPHY